MFISLNVDAANVPKVMWCIHEGEKQATMYKCDIRTLIDLGFADTPHKMHFIGQHICTIH